MKDLFSGFISNIGSKLKGFFLGIYIIECVAAFISAIIGFVWCLCNDFVWYGMLYILGGILAPLILYPAFMIVYGYAIIVHNMEKGTGSTNTPDEQSNASGLGVLIVIIAVILIIAVLICSCVYFGGTISGNIQNSTNGEVYNPDTTVSEDTYIPVTTSYYDN